MRDEKNTLFSELKALSGFSSKISTPRNSVKEGKETPTPRSENKMKRTLTKTIEKDLFLSTDTQRKIYSDKNIRKLLSSQGTFVLII